MNQNKNQNFISKFSWLMITVLTLSLIIFSSCETDETQEVVNFTNLVWEDDFNANGAPNPGNWTYDIGTGVDGWGNGELQYYTNRAENAVIENGMLRITARQENFEGSQYTSARLLTKGLFEKRYGRFEARMKLPWGQGMWPAFWLLGSDFEEVGWPQCGEIDVMENRGSEPTIISGTVHGPGYNAGLSISKEYDFVNERVDTDFHVYGIEWGPNYINFYVDDVLYNQITPEDVPGEWVFNDEFYVIINLAVGGRFGGPPNENTVFPQTMYVDYVRVYD